MGYFYLRLQHLESQKTITNIALTTNTKEQNNQPEIAMDEDKDITNNWKTYTFDPKKDIDQKIFQFYPSLFIPNFSFKYPSYFKLVRTRSDIYENTDPYKLSPSLKGARTIGVSFQLKQEEAGSPCSQGVSGPCHGIDLEFTLGITPKDLSDFNVDFWGGGHVIDRVERVKINNIPARLAYFYEQSRDYPTTSLFITSPDLQLRVRVNEYECKTEICLSAKNEINKILTTFKRFNQNLSGDISDWKTYSGTNRRVQLGFPQRYTFSYPPEWELDESKSTSELAIRVSNQKVGLLLIDPGGHGRGGNPLKTIRAETVNYPAGSVEITELLYSNNRVLGTFWFMGTPNNAPLQPIFGFEFDYSYTHYDNLKQTMDQILKSVNIAN